MDINWYKIRRTTVISCRVMAGSTSYDITLNSGLQCHLVIKVDFSNACGLGSITDAGRETQLVVGPHYQAG